MCAKVWKDLKASQRMRLSEAMFKMVCDYFRGQGQMPDGTDVEKLAGRFYNNGRGSGLSYESVYEVFARKQAHFAERIEKSGLPESPRPKVKKTEAERPAIKRAIRKRKKAELAAQEQERLPEQDERFFLIAGCTSGGAPYGVTWEEMGLESWNDPVSAGLPIERFLFL